MTQTCRSLDEKATRWQNHPLWSKTSALMGVSWSWGAGKVCGQASCISFSWRNAECPKTTCWEDSFLLHKLSRWCAYIEPIMTAVCKLSARLSHQHLSAEISSPPLFFPEDHSVKVRCSHKNNLRCLPWSLLHPATRTLKQHSWAVDPGPGWCNRKGQKWKWEARLAG